MSSQNGTTPGLVVLSSGYGGVIHSMWVPCVVFAHLFAAYFLARMLAVMYPRAWNSMKRRLLNRGDVRRRLSSSGSAVASTATSGTTKAAAPGAKLVAPAPAGQHTVVAADTGADGDQDRRPVSDSNGANAGAAVHTVTTVYHDAAEDIETASGSSSGSSEQDALQAPSAAGSGQLRSVPSRRSQELMRRLTTRAKPMTLEWQNLGCSYSTSAGTKTVLQGVWGRAAPGDMVALMGPSGAGKSTLMDMLAGRKSVGGLTGAVLVNGLPRRQREFACQTAYVPQDDNFLPTMTVQETCSYYASLLLPSSCAGGARRERIHEVLAAMGLSHTMDTLVGGTLPGGIVLRGLSGGERKRLSIATGIMSTPCVVFLDEPTSGLDSFAALSVMSYMRSLASNGQTVVSSIHQPRAAIWALFDTTVLLSMGRMMYTGPRDELVPWFTSGCGYSYDPVMHGLASDWVMDLVNIGFRKPESLFGRMMNSRAELDSSAAAFLAKYLEGPHNHTPTPALEAALNGGGNSKVGSKIKTSGSGAQLAADMQRVLDEAELGQAQAQPTGWCCGLGAPASSITSASWFTQFRVLLWRELLAVTRNPADVAGRCLIFCWLALFVGLIYYDLPVGIDALRSRLNVLFVEPVILLLLPYVYMSLYTSDKQYFIADSSAKLYKPSAYYAAKQLAVLPFAVLNVLLFSFTLYGLAGLRPDGWAAGINGAMSVLIYLIAAQVLAFAAVVTPNQDTAFMLAIAWTAINLLLSNFMVRYVDMTQKWFSQLRYVSAMGYAFEGYARAEFGGVGYSCAGGLAPSLMELLPRFFPNTPLLSSPALLAQVGSPSPGCVVDLDSLLTYFGLSRPFWLTAVILLGYLGVFHVATYGGFLLLTRKEKR